MARKIKRSVVADEMRALMRQAQEETGLTVAEIARRYGCSHQNIRQALLGSYMTAPHKFERFMQACGYVCGVWAQRAPEE